MNVLSRFLAQDIAIMMDSVMMEAEVIMIKMMIGDSNAEDDDDDGNDDDNDTDGGGGGGGKC